MDDKENRQDNKAEIRSRECCACNLPKSGDFKQVISLRNSGLTVFIHKNVEVQKTSRKKSEETFILHNIGEKELKRPDYINEMCQYKTKCIKCKALVHKVRSLIDEIDDIKTDEVLGVCEYCKRSNATSKCRRCEYIVSKYLSLKSKVYQNKQARFVAWLTKVNDLLRDILDIESVCKHKLYRDSHSVLELEQLLSELKSPLSQRQPEITYFPTKAAERLMSFGALGQSKDMLEDILKRIKTEKTMHYTSDDSLLLSSSRSSTGCVCKYFMSKKMEGRRSMEVLPQEKYYPPGLITSREFAKSLTSDQRFRRSLDRERHGRRRPSSADYDPKKSGYHSDYSRDGTSKERGKHLLLSKISSELISGRSQDSGLSRDEYGKERRSKRDEYGSSRESKRDDYGSSRESKRDDYGSARGSKKDDYGIARGSKGDDYGIARGSKRDEYGKERGSKKDDYGIARGSKRNDYGSPRGSKRDEYGKERGSKRDEYGEVRESKKEVSAGAKDKMPGIPSKKSRVGEDISRERKEKDKEGKRESLKEDVSKKRDTTKAGKIKEDTKEGTSKVDKLKGDTTKRDKTDKTKETNEKEDTKKGKSKADKLKGDTTKTDKTDKTKETVEKVDTKESESKADRLKEDATKKDKTDKTKEEVEKEDTEEGKSKADRLKEDATKTDKTEETVNKKDGTEGKLKEDTTKRDKTDKTKETFKKEDTKGGKSKADKSKGDREGKTKEEITKKDVKLGDSIELVFKVGKTRKGKSSEPDAVEDIAKKAKDGSSKPDDLKEDKKDKGKTEKGEKKSTTYQRDKSKKVEEKSKKLREDIIIVKGDKNRSKQKKKDIQVIIKDEEIRKRLKNKGTSKGTTDQSKEEKSEESLSDKENVDTLKKIKGKKGKESEKEKKKKSTTEIPIKKKKASSEAVLLLKMMKELRIKREKEREAKKEKLKEFADLAPLPVIKRTVKPKVEPLVSESFVECDDSHVRHNQEMIVGNRIGPFDPHFKLEKERDHAPLLFEIMQSFPDVVLPQIEVPDKEAPPSQAESKKKPISSSSTKMKSKSKILEEFAEGTAGVMKYQLSNRKYIEEGWTVLPTTKILRKMNTYNMKLANPEFDFFKVNKKKKIMFYDTGEKLAEIYSNESGKWFYRNGNLALRCYHPKEPNIRKRYIVYSSGEEKDNGTYLPITILGIFDQLGNAIIYDYFGNARMKYNQSEGMIIDEKIGPPGRWKWHTLNDPPVLQPVFIDSYLQERDGNLEALIRSVNETTPEQNSFTKDQNVDMVMIEFENFVKEKAHKLLQKFKPFQIRMKAVKINEHFSFRVLDQASVNLIFQDAPNTLKLNLGMNLINTEIVDTETSEVSDVATPYDRIPARTESVSNIQEALNKAKKYGKSIRNRKQSASSVKRPRGVRMPPNIPNSGLSV